MNGTVFKFLTHEQHLPRTFGLVMDRRGCALPHARDATVRDLAGAANHHPGACAFGKVAFLSDNGIHTFQATPAGEFESVFCGNSTAAAVGVLGGADVVATMLHGAAPGAYALSASFEQGMVVQTWTMPDPEVAIGEWQGQPLYRLRGVNDYAILVGSLPDGADAEAIRCEILGQGLASKLAVIRETADGAVVDFYNSNGRHGAAPLTGLAAIAFAVRSDESLERVFPAGSVNCSTVQGVRAIRMPSIMAHGPDEVRLQFGGVEVSLEPLETEVAG